MIHADDIKMPITIKNAFDPKNLLDCEPRNFVNTFKALSPKIPVQVHFPGFENKKLQDKDCPPLITRVVDMLSKYPELEEYLNLNSPTHEEKSDPITLKLRVSEKGNFLQRNNQMHRNMILYLDGKAH